MADLVHKELSYKLIGILYKVHSELGGGYQEKYYQRAVATELKNSGLSFKEQVHMPLKYKGEKIGSFYLDFLVEDKIVLELKKDKSVSRRTIEQIVAYLKAFNLSLGIVANFTDKGVRFKRILNLS